MKQVQTAEGTKRLPLEQRLCFFAAILLLLLGLSSLWSMNRSAIELEAAQQTQLVTVSGTLTNEQIAPSAQNHPAYLLYLDTYPDLCFQTGMIDCRSQLEACLTAPRSAVTLTIAADSQTDTPIAVYGISIGEHPILTPEQYFETWHAKLRFALWMGLLFVTSSILLGIAARSRGLWESKPPSTEVCPASSF
jgi:hypothetical protein